MNGEDQGERRDFEELARELVSSERAEQAVRNVLADHDHPHWLGLMTVLLAYAHGQPRRRIDLRGARVSIESDDGEGG